MVFPLKGWGVHGPSRSGVCGCFIGTRLGLVFGTGRHASRVRKLLQDFLDELLVLVAAVGSVVLMSW